MPALGGFLLSAWSSLILSRLRRQYPKRPAHSWRPGDRGATNADAPWLDCCLDLSSHPRSPKSSDEAIVRRQETETVAARDESASVAEKSR